MYRVDYSWLHGAVKHYFERNGIKLLRDDLAYIEKCLAQIPKEGHRKVMIGYFNTWKEFDEDGLKKANARFQANSYLRSAVSDEDYHRQ